MPVTRTTSMDAVELRRFLLADGYSETDAMAAVLRAFSATVDGRVQRRPQSLIVQAVCEFYSLTIAELTTRNFPVRARARRAAMYLLVTAANMSTTEAARAVGKKHRSEAERAVKVVDDDPALKAEVAAIAELVESRCHAPKLPVVWPRAMGVVR
jgi:chromosomal replication initiation ATPase DnaA